MITFENYIKVKEILENKELDKEKILDNINKLFKSENMSSNSNMSNASDVLKINKSDLVKILTPLSFKYPFIRDLLNMSTKL